MVWELLPTFVEVTEKKLAGRVFPPHVILKVKQTILIFGLNLPKKNIYHPNQEKWTLLSNSVYPNLSKYYPLP